MLYEVITVFKGVMSPVIRLEIEKNGGQSLIEINGKEFEFSRIKAKRNQFRPPYISSADEIEKLV